MEIKHLRSDFIRSFLCLHFDKPIPEYDLSNEKDLKSIKIAKFHNLIDFPSIILINCPIIPELIIEKYPFYPFTEIVDRHKSLLDSSKRAGIPNNDIILKIGESLLINKNQINTNEYYTLLPHVFKSFTNDVSPILEKINNTAYEDVLISLNKDNLTKISDLITALPNTTNSTLDTKLTELNTELANINTRYRAIKQAIAHLYAEKAMNIVNNINPFTKFLTYLLKCKVVKSIFTPKLDGVFKCSINLDWFPISYTYGDTALQKMVYENPQFKNNNNKGIIYDALKDRQHYEIMHTPVQITIRYDFSNYRLSYDICSVIHRDDLSHSLPEFKIRNASLKELLLHCFRNVHFFEFNCLGSFRPDIDQASNESNPTRLFATLLQYLSTINITDGAGTRWLNQPHIFKRKADNTWFLMEPATGELTEIPEHIIRTVDFKYKKGIYIKEDNL